MALRSNNRRWFRFGLRTLLIAITVLCIWLGFKVNAARRQHEVVQAILQAGGTVAYDYQLLRVPGDSQRLQYRYQGHVVGCPIGCDRSSAMISFAMYFGLLWQRIESRFRT